jgi:hypothetical protein
MNPKLVTGPLCHDLVVLMILEKWPQLVHGTDYLVLHAIDADGNQAGPPYFATWKPKDIPLPDISELDAQFTAHDGKYRSALARHYRDSLLEWSDPKVSTPDDAPATTRTDIDAWKTYRQALRDVPQQAGFPMGIEWPELPGQSADTKGDTT